MAKLAAFNFDLKYVPRVKNTVTDALSREPFVQSCVGHRLLKEPYIALLDEVNGVVRGTVQDAFRLTNNCQVVQDARSESSDLNDLQTVRSSISSDVVSASAHRGCGHLSANLPLPQMPDEDPSTVIPQSQLLSLQEQDPTISRVLFYVQRKRKATRREAATEPACVSKLLRHWKKLKVQNGILYRVRKDNRLNKKLSQFIVLDGLKH